MLQTFLSSARPLSLPEVAFNENRPRCEARADVLFGLPDLACGALVRSVSDVVRHGKATALLLFDLPGAQQLAERT